MTYEEKVAWLRRYQQSLRQERELERSSYSAQPGLPRHAASFLHANRHSGRSGHPPCCGAHHSGAAELERQIAICADTRRDIITIINQITDARDQEILRRRYLLGQHFEQIAVEMHLEYRWVRRRHKQAMNVLIF